MELNPVNLTPTKAPLISPERSNLKFANGIIRFYRAKGPKRRFAQSKVISPFDTVLLNFYRRKRFTLYWCYITSERGRNYNVSRRERRFHSNCAPIM